MKPVNGHDPNSQAPFGMPAALHKLASKIQKEILTTNKQFPDYIIGVDITAMQLGKDIQYEVKVRGMTKPDPSQQKPKNDE